MRQTKETSGLVLVVEDNRNISEMIGEYLEGRGFEVDYAQDGLDGYRLAAENSYDVVVLDLMLPRLDGIEVCRRLRNDARKSTPVLMLTARDTLDDKLTGLGFGADDYLTKPFAIQELEARLRALIRRERRQVGSEVLKVADLVLDPVSMRATRAGTELQLSPIGLRLLTILMRESPRVVTRGLSRILAGAAAGPAGLWPRTRAGHDRPALPPVIAHAPARRGALPIIAAL